MLRLRGFVGRSSAGASSAAFGYRPARKKGGWPADRGLIAQWLLSCDGGGETGVYKIR